jgi:hypothetical protein
VQNITKDAAERAIEKLSLSDKNRAFAGYWLSLWQGNELPRPERFDLARLPTLTPGVMVFDVLPDRSITVRSAGIDICRAVGQRLNGIDWITHAAVRNRGLRIRNFTGVAEGSVLIGRRPFLLAGGSLRINEELALPLAADADGASTVIAYTDWKTDEPDWFKNITDISRIAQYNQMLSLRPRKPARRAAAS